MKNTEKLLNCRKIVLQMSAALTPGCQSYKYLHFWVIVNLALFFVTLKIMPETLMKKAQKHCLNWRKTVL